MIDGETPVLLYGGGGFGRWIAETLRGLGRQVDAVIDRDPAACAWAAALDIDTAADRHPRATAVIGVFSPQPDVRQIAEDLRRSGVATVVTPPQLFAWLADQGVVAQRYWLSTDGTALANESAYVARARDALADQESIDVFDGLLAYRTSGDPAVCPRPRHLEEQHTGLDFGFLPSVTGVIVDCGAFTGDTFANWEAAGLTHDVVLALEPDDSTFPAMVAAARESTLRVIPLPIGVTESTGRYAVEGSGASATLVASAAGATVAMSLDDLLASVPLTTLVKMDIEGGEAGALRGGLAVLRRDHPRLAVSVYHKPHHLWRIQNWLAREVGGYMFRLRVYGHQGYDTVLYCTPTDP